MNEELINKLKIAVNQFYLGKYLDQPRIDDKEFDELAKMHDEFTGRHRSWMELVEFPTDKVEEPNLPETALGKTACDGDFDEYIQDYIKSNAIGSDHYLTYKYDGCAIKAIYENGRLKKIQSTPDEHIGIVRTKAFYPFFPNKLKDKTITALRGEVLVDAAVYGELARNKANGLTNSVHMDHDVRKEAFVRIYKVQYKDGQNSYQRQLDTLLSLHPINITRIRPVYDEVTMKVTESKVTDTVFCIGERVFDLPKTTVIQELTTESTPKFQIDGVVMYYNKGYNHNGDGDAHAFKFYYTDYAVVEIKNISWSYRWDNGSYAPVAEFNTTTINGKNISRCSLNGVNNMIDNKIGVGSKVKIILANLTIPYIIEVLSTSEDFNLPKCDCGYQLTVNDRYGNSLKCSNHNCSRRVHDLYEHLENLVGFIDEEDGEVKIRTYKKSIEDLIQMPHFFIDLFIIDRFNSSNKFRISQETQQAINEKFEPYAEMMDDEDIVKELNEIKSEAINAEYIKANKEIYEALMGGNESDIDHCICKWYNMSDLQYSIASRNFLVISEVIVKFTSENGVRIIK